jgi:putative transposase
VDHILFGEDMLRRTIRESVMHYHEERNHQAMDNQLLTTKPTIVDWSRSLRKRERVGGPRKYYFREAA